MGIPIFFVMQALRTVIMTIMGATFTRVVSSTSTTMYIGIPAGVSNSPESHNIRLVFPISPNGYYDGDEVPTINIRSYGKHLQNLIIIVLSTVYRMMVSSVIDIQIIFPAVYRSTVYAKINISLYPRNNSFQ